MLELIAILFLLFFILASIVALKFLHSLARDIHSIACTNKSQVELYRNAVLPDIVCDQVESVLEKICPDKEDEE